MCWRRYEKRLLAEPLTALGNQEIRSVERVYCPITEIQ